MHTQTSVSATTRVRFVPVGRGRREWMWKARDEGSKTIAISGQRFESLTDAVRDARTRFLSEEDDGPLAA
jgi:hypothetical protein